MSHDCHMTITWLLGVSHYYDNTITMQNCTCIGNGGYKWHPIIRERVIIMLERSLALLLDEHPVGF